VDVVMFDTEYKNFLNADGWVYHTEDGQYDVAFWAMKEGGTVVGFIPFNGSMVSTSLVAGEFVKK